MPDISTAETFLAAGPCAGWTVTPLAGDASARSYARLTAPDGRSAILMDGGPGAAAEVPRFLAIAAHLSSLGLCPPAILDRAPDDRLLLLEDLGPNDIAATLREHPHDENRLYSAATDVILAAQSAPAPGGLSVLDPVGASALIDPLFDWAAPGTPPDIRTALKGHLAEALACAGPPTQLALRDYHAENLIWRPDRIGTDRIGLLDFQDAVVAPAAYDLVSLLRDARRDVSDATRAAMIDRFARATGQSAADVATACAVLGVQRNLRIVGIFARLVARDGKRRYAALTPRVTAQLRADLAHPALAATAPLAVPLLESL